MERTGRSEADSKRVTVAIAQSAPVYLNKRDSALIVAGLANPAWKIEIEAIACG
jgi:enamine deaminase RidA (YjgF/YER057c/UK114 family)